LPHLVAGDRHPPSVHVDVPVADELTGLGPARAPTGPEDRVVEAQLEHPQQVLAGDTGLASGLLVEVAKLLLQEPVDPAGLLLLPELEHVLRLPDATPAMITGRVRTPLDGALHGVAFGTLEEELHLLPAAQPADGPGVARHQCFTLARLSSPSNLWSRGEIIRRASASA